MNKTVILSSNDNPDYLKYYPYVAWAWNQLGWDTLLFYNGKDNLLMKEYMEVKDHFDGTRNQVIPLANLEGYRSATIVQVSRLFGCLCYTDDRMIMTGDVDMIPLVDYWHPAQGKITTYGWDLTNQGHFPICYIATNAEIWRKVMGIGSKYNSIDEEIKKLLDKTPKAKSEIFEEWWQVDQDIITDLLLRKTINGTQAGGCSAAQVTETLTQIPIAIREDVSRGTQDGLAMGRVDRYDWERTQHVLNQIDAHMPRPFDLEKTKAIIFKNFGKLPGWI